MVQEEVKREFVQYGLESTFKCGVPKEEQKLALNIMFDGIDTFKCLECGNPAYIHFDRRYNGDVGFCSTCNVSWRES